MKKAQFTDADAVSAANEFQTYMSPRIVAAGGMNGPVTVYGENPNKRKPTLAPLDENDDGILQELSY